MLRAGQDRAVARDADEDDAPDGDAGCERSQIAGALGDRPRDEPAPRVADDVELQRAIAGAIKEAPRVLDRVVRDRRVVVGDHPPTVAAMELLSRVRRQPAEAAFGRAEGAVDEEQDGTPGEHLPGLVVEVGEAAGRAVRPDLRWVPLDVPLARHNRAPCPITAAMGNVITRITLSRPGTGAGSCHSRAPGPWFAR